MRDGDAMSSPVLALVLAAVAVAPRTAHADQPEPPTPPPSQSPQPADEPRPELDKPVLRYVPRTDPITVDIPGERSRTNKLVLGSLVATAAVVGAIGLKFNLDSRDAADQVSTQRPTGQVWSPALQAVVDDADAARRNATIAYTIGSLALTAAIAGYLITDPKSQKVILRPTANVSPTGALVGGVLRW